MNKRILIVDDDLMNLRFAEFVLKDNNYTIIKAESGMECLEIIKTTKVDLILLDIEMPVMNGIQTLELIRNNDKYKNIPVMFLTADAVLESVVKAAQLGAVEYIKKPFKPEELLFRVNKFFK